MAHSGCRTEVEGRKVSPTRGAVSRVLGLLHCAQEKWPKVVRNIHALGQRPGRKKLEDWGQGGVGRGMRIDIGEKT